MKTTSFFLLVAAMGLLLSSARADTVELKDGSRLEGIVKKVEHGQVTIQVGPDTKVVEILQVLTIDFDTERLTTGTPRLPLEHFLASMEEQEMVGHFRDVEQSAAKVRKLIEETQAEWAERPSVESSQTVDWVNAKERFSTPLSRYQEVLNDLYFHVLGKVDEYNELMKEADSIRVGVKGMFQVGSSLITRDQKRLPLKKYVPAQWYDTIFYDGYNLGYNEAYEKYRDRF